MSEPTYEELLGERRREWSAAQAIVAKEHADLQEKLQRMPDVVPPDSPWESKDVACGCGGRVFNVSRWVTLNGKKCRAELECVRCRTVGTWDWGERKWIG